MLLLLRREGIADVVVVGGRSPRLAVARELGASQVVNYHATDDLAAAIRAIHPAPFPNVVEASGSGAAMAASLAVAARDGHILVVGDYDAARADFGWNDMMHRELEIIGSNASAGGWPEAARLAAAGEITLAPLVTQQLPAERFAEGVELTRSRSGEVIKVVLMWGDQ